MPPADPAALREALATLRQLFADNPDYPWELPEMIASKYFLTLLDAGDLVRVRGLEWKEVGNGWKAITTMGTAVVWFSFVHEGWMWAFNKGRPPFDNYRCESFDAAKLAAESHYRSRLAAALEPLLLEVRT